MNADFLPPAFRQILDRAIGAQHRTLMRGDSSIVIELVLEAAGFRADRICVRAPGCEPAEIPTSEAHFLTAEEAFEDAERLAIGYLPRG